MLRVISRTSVMRYKKVTKRLPDIARELGVEAIVEGSVMRVDRELHISAQLIDATTDRHLWAHKYSGSISEANAIEKTIAQSIASAIGIPLSAAQQRATQMNPDTLDAYLKGVFAAGRQNPEGLRTAVRYFEDAVAKQPDCAVCYAWLGLIQLQLVYAGEAPAEVIPKAELAARKALEIDPAAAIGHRVLGTILHVYYWRCDGDRELQRARDLAPNSAEAHRALATANIRRGRFKEAMAELDKARAIDPVSLQTLIDPAVALRAGGQYDRAIALLRDAIPSDPSSPRTHYELAVTYVAMHRIDDAIAEVDEANRLSGNPRFKAYLGFLYASAGRTAEARKILHELEKQSQKHYCRRLASR
jgi:tetratricopeptide (TPR) repeat protein